MSNGKERKTKWTKFWDMSSGGGQKLDWHFIFIEAPENEAKVYFEDRFGRDPENVSCDCCGEDYSISESDSLGDLIGFHLGWKYQYFDKDGGKISEEKAWKRGKGLVNGATGRYIEEPDDGHFGKYFKTLEQAMNDGTVGHGGTGKEFLVIRASDMAKSKGKGKRK